jgi:hypothetical protein
MSIKKSNSIRFTTEKTINNGTEVLIAKIRLNDECRNGHQDFSVTGESYVAGKPRTDRNMLCCGAMGDTIKQHFPELGILCDLHLCDYNGIPMHAVANMYYHLHNRFGSNGPDVGTPEHENKFKEYYRISNHDYEIISKAKSKRHFQLLVMETDILSNWHRQARTAIALLEELSGYKFVNDSVRSNYVPMPQEDIADELKLIESGYYSEEQIAKREQQKAAAERLAIIQDTDNKIRKLELERDINLAIFDVAGKRGVEHTIYYSHLKAVKFNWRKFGEQLTESEIENIKTNAKLPNGITFK